MISIPVTNQPNQELEAVIPLSPTLNIALAFYFSFNEVANYWEMSISDGNTGQELISSLPMITSSPAQNLIAQWEYLGIGSCYILPLTEAAQTYPGLNDWGVNYSLIWE